MSRNKSLMIDSDKLRELLALKCWTVKEFANNAGVSYNAVSNMINGHSFPYPATLKKICAALEIEPTDIIKRKE